MRYRPSALAAFLLALTLSVACSGRDSEGEPFEEAGAASKELSETEAWVDVYYPDRAEPGYNMILYRRRHPTLIDMNGRIVHSWPEARAAGRARLLEDGSVLVLGQDGALRVYGWDGGVEWEYRLPGEDFPHHDLIQLANGSRFTRPKKRSE